MRNAQIFDLSAVFAEQIAVSKPLIREAYEKLGETEVKALKYHTGNIRRKLVARLHTSTIDKVVRLCKQTFPEQSPIPLARIKDELQAIYAQLGISHKAKATDIQQWCETKESSIYSDGKKVKCLTIIRYSIARIK